MREVFGYKVKSISDHAHKELMPVEVYDIFTKEYVNIERCLTVNETHYTQLEGGIQARVNITYNGETKEVVAEGNGRLDAISNAILQVVGKIYTLDSYTQHALEDATTSQAASYVSIKNVDGELFWGVGINRDIIVSSVKALVSAVNRLIEKRYK